MGPKFIKQSLKQILPTVQKPGRYTGGELNQVVKDWDRISLRVALAFPDIYDLGMSNLGIAILYDILNRQPNILAERVYSPWIDMEAALRKVKVPLYSLESKHPIADFDLLGISLPYETLYTNALNMLDLAGIPLHTVERSRKDAIVIAGGHAAFNPEPMADFIDAFVIGDGEDVILDIAQKALAWKASGRSRRDFLRQLAQISGVYVPSLYKVHYHNDGVISSIQPLTPEARMPVLKRIVPQLPPPLTDFIVPYIEIVHDRIPIEIMRGCTRGCRFCQAGMITRPVRERPVDEIVTAIDQALQQTGYEEVGLLSLSSSDYENILKLLKTINQRFSNRHLNVSLPSLRIESFSIELMNLLQGESHRGGFTLAPEAATESLRKVINKPISSEQVLSTVHEIYSHGWHTIKLYFMIGQPSETDEDIKAIVKLCKSILAEGYKVLGKRAQVNASIGTFVPKPHTPFQWVPCAAPDQIEAKQALLRRELRGRGLKLNWTDPKQTMLEAWLSRGDRRLCQVIELAWKNGARFDAWREHFNYESWMQAFNLSGLDPAFYASRERSIDETLPWDHIDAGLRKEYLAEDYRWSLQGRIRPDCRNHCSSCGILSKFADLRRENPGNIWKCPEIKSSDRRDMLSSALPPKTNDD
jgi:radical SAM family uncharacterized protein